LLSFVTNSPDWTRLVTSFFTSAIPGLRSAVECPNLISSNSFAHRLRTGNSALRLAPGPVGLKPKLNQERTNGHREGLQNRPRRLPVENVVSNRQTHVVNLYIRFITCVSWVRHRQPTGPGPALPEEESRRRNKGRDAQLLQSQRPELHRRAPTLGFIHPVSFTWSTPQSHPPGLLTRAWVAEPTESTGSS